MKRYVTALLALLLTASFVGCVGDTTSDVSDSVATGQTQEDGELLIWYDTCSKDIMMGLITEFQKEYPGIEVITEDYSDMIIPDYRTKLAGELMAGGGPDIVLSNHDNNNVVQNLTKLLQNGIFHSFHLISSCFSQNYLLFSIIAQNSPKFKLKSCKSDERQKISPLAGGGMEDYFSFL